MARKGRAPTAATGGARDTSEGNRNSVARERIVVVIETDTRRRSPRELREHAREAWLAALDRAFAAGRIELVIVEELRRAWPPAEART